MTLGAEHSLYQELNDSWGHYWASLIAQLVKIPPAVQLLSRVWLFVTLWTAACQTFLSFTISQNLFKLVPIESSNHLILCHPLSSCPQSFPASGTFPESALHIRWPKYQSFSFSINPSNEYSGLISFRIDWLDLLTVQWTLMSLLKCHSLKVLLC